MSFKKQWPSDLVEQECGFDKVQTGPKWRNNYCKGEESLESLREEIAHVAIPESDPVYGVEGPLVRIWKAARRA